MKQLIEKVLQKIEQINKELTEARTRWVQTSQPYEIYLADSSYLKGKLDAAHEILLELYNEEVNNK